MAYPYTQPSSYYNPTSYTTPAYGYGSSTQYNTTNQGFPWMWFIVGILICIGVAWIVHQVLKRMNTRPVSESFLSMPVKGATGVPCGQMSSEAEALYSMFASVKLNVMKETDLDLLNLKELLGRLCCLKRDLMSPIQTVSSARELGFATHMDIQPLADLTASCFAKTIPERDLSIQFDKWNDFGLKLISRLCLAASFSESQAQEAESLFKSCWQDTYSVSKGSCISTIPKSAFSSNSPRDPAPSSPESIVDLGPYTGRY